MNKEAAAFYGRFLNESIAAEKADVLETTGERLTDKEAETLLENDYFDIHRPLDFGNLLNSLNGMSGKWLENRYVSYVKHYHLFSKIAEANDVETEAENSERDYSKIKSANIGKVVSDLGKLFGFPSDQIQINKRFHKIFIVLVAADRNGNVETLKRFMDEKEGYFVSKDVSKLAGPLATKWAVLVFEPYTSNNGDVYKGKKLFHVSPTVNRASILENGIVPKSINNFYDYPPRVYGFIDGTDYKEFMADCRRIARAAKIKNFDMHTVDISGSKSVFFWNPNCKNGAFTYDRIPPESITSTVALPEFDIPDA